ASHDDLRPALWRRRGRRRRGWRRGPRLAESLLKLLHRLIDDLALAREGLLGGAIRPAQCAPRDAGGRGRRGTFLGLEASRGSELALGLEAASQDIGSRDETAETALVDRRGPRRTLSGPHPW